MAQKSRTHPLLHKWILVSISPKNISLTPLPVTLVGANQIIQFPGNYDWFRPRLMTYVGSMGFNQRRSFMMWGSFRSPLLNVNRKLPACIMLWSWGKPAWGQTQHELVEHKAEKYQEKPNTTVTQLCLGVCPTCRRFYVYFCLNQSSFQITWETEKNANSGLHPKADWVRDLEWCLWMCVGWTRSSWHSQARHGLRSNNVYPVWVKISINYYQMYPYK